MLSIKEIADKIVIEADIQANEYPIVNRLIDINQTILDYVELADQLGSKEPMSEAETVTEEFSVSVGNNTFQRTLVDMPVFRVDFQPNSQGDFCRVTEDLHRSEDDRCYCIFDQEFFVNEKEVFMNDVTQPGTLRVTYVRGDITLFDINDYNAASPVYPTRIPSVFHKLLWLEPAWRQASFYKSDRAGHLEKELTIAKELFRNHYARNAKYRGQIMTRNTKGNYR